MNFGIRFHDCEALPFAQRAAAARAQGFGCIQLAPKFVLEAFPGDSALTPGLAMHLRAILAKNSLDTAVLGCYLNLLHPDTEALAAIQRTYRHYLQFAAWLGAGVVGTETGCPNAAYRPVPECHTDECFAQFVQNLTPVLADAEKLGVVLGIEPVYHHAVYCPQRARQLLDALPSPNLKIIFDPVNLLHAENAHLHTELMEESIALFGAEIAVLHLKDYTLEGGFQNNVPVGFGAMDYTALMRYSKRYKPQLHATLEDTKPENAAEALHRIAALYERA